MAERQESEGGLERARKKAMQLLRVKLRSTAELRARLGAKGFAADDIEMVLGELARARVLDDAALAEADVRRIKERGPVGAGAMRAKLERRGLNARGLGDDAGSSPEDVRAFAVKKLATMSAKVSDKAKARRLFGLLARRGIDVEMAMEIVEQLTGVRGS